MRLLKPRFVVVAALLALSPVALVGACGGGAFESAQDEQGGEAGSGGTASSSGTGTGAGSKDACDGPEDCDDGDVCSTDQCTDGACTATPKCTGTLKCCEFECAQCCDDSDCDDGVSCTADKCVAGQCMFVPNNGACAPNEYCNLTESCRPRIPCGEADPTATCDDGSACTEDRCADNFCDNSFCGTSTTAEFAGELCCATGCAEECCDDSQCNRDDDPCTAGSCVAGKCRTVPLCGEGGTCCPSADGKSALCGTCCSAADCNDNVPCTDDQCSVGACKNVPVDQRCDADYVCNPTKGCEKAVSCRNDSECTSEGCGKCVQGVCSYGCASGKCCGSTCATCCTDTECSDGIGCTVDTCTSGSCQNRPDSTQCSGGYQCQPSYGGCVQCTSASDCNDNNACTTDSCTPQGICLYSRVACPNGQVCNGGRCAECKVAADCNGIISKQQGPIPIGEVCHACVDGKCQYVECLGVCCSYGCSKTLVCLEPL